ncbi:MAG: hypothetical protein WDO73_04125 [Ignavibacteriota bacterium]
MRTLLCIILTFGAARAADAPGVRLQLLATNRISTMEKEMNQAAASGYRYAQFVGGDTSFGGQEVVVAMAKPLNGPAEPTKTYRVISAALVSNLEKDLKRAGDDGFEWKATAIFHVVGGTAEPVCILEHAAGSNRQFSYRILTTARTSTMQKELQDAGHDGFKLLGVTLSKTLLGVSEVVAVLSKD